MKTRYYLELLTPETMKLLGITKSKVTKDENGENMPYLEITEVILIYYNVVNNSYQQNSKVLNKFDHNKPLVNYQIFHPKVYIFKNF